MLSWSILQYFWPALSGIFSGPLRQVLLYATPLCFFSNKEHNNLKWVIIFVWISECGPLDQPCNGHVDSSGVLPGDVANYSCETGYELQGESSRTCLDNWEWDGIAPCCVKTCRRKLTFVQLNPAFSCSEITVDRDQQPFGYIFDQ